MAILMGGMVASISIASRSLDDGAGPAGRTLAAAGVLEELNADLALAVSFSERTPTAVTFTVPDRTGDGQPETIRYRWSGEPDCRLLRQVNGEAEVTIAQDVRYFNLTYCLKTVSPAQDRRGAIDPPGGDGADRGVRPNKGRNGHTRKDKPPKGQPPMHGAGMRAPRR